MGDETIIMCCSFGAHGIAAGEERGAGWAADGLGVEAGKLHPLLGHLVNAWGLDVW